VVLSLVGGAEMETLDTPEPCRGRQHLIAIREPRITKTIWQSDSDSEYLESKLSISSTRRGFDYRWF
jgi:hypothetical protein